jgi:hypothetical protein
VTQTTSVVRLQFLAANPHTVMNSGEALPGKVNYFTGTDPTQWHSDVPTYASAKYEQLYAGIDLTYEGTGGELKGTYTVAAGSDPAQLRWRYSGAENMTIDETGSLQITLATGKEAPAVTEQVPVAWQAIDGTRMLVSAPYLVATDRSIGFALGRYDPHDPLIMDPDLTYSTYLGGSACDLPAQQRHAGAVEQEHSGAEGWTETLTGQTFADVPMGRTYPNSGFF